MYTVVLSSCLLACLQGFAISAHQEINCCMGAAEYQCNIQTIQTQPSYCGMMYSRLCHHVQLCCFLNAQHSTSAMCAAVCAMFQICSSCRGQLQALGRFNVDGTPAKARAPSQYSLFVKDNFASQKQKCGPGTPHKDVMQALATSWKARAVTAQESVQPARVTASSCAESACA